MSASKQIIVIRKIAGVIGGLPPMDPANHIAGTSENITQNKSLPIEYEVEGSLLAPMEIGKSVYLMRTKRNGVNVSGLFQTSRLTEITENTFKTQNSLYVYNHL